MDTPFPFGFPPATAFYLVLYVATLAIHVVFMNYVLAGAGYLAVAGLLRGRRLFETTLGRRPSQVLLDWLPFMLSGAITAGIAPLLFVQILYQQEFYTANLLLFNRWMSILPVLIIGFYALYLLKTGWIHRQSSWVVALLGVVPFLCIGFTGYSWTENHLLSVRGQAYWSQFFRENQLFYYETQLVPRLLVWACGAIPTMALIVAWQLNYQRHNDPGWEGGGPLRNLGWLALAGLGLSIVGVAIMLAKVSVWDEGCLGAMGLPYFLLAGLGLILQAFSWIYLVWKKEGPRSSALFVATGGVVCTIVGMSVCREAIRLATLGPTFFTSLYPKHERASAVGGLVVFLFFLILNAVLVSLCFLLVKRGQRDKGP